MSKNYDKSIEKEEQIARGERIKKKKKKELRLNKSDLAKKIGVSSQFLGLVEDGKGNLMYRSIKKLRDLSGHSADYIIYGLDDTVLNTTKKYMEYFSENELKEGINILNDLIYLLKNKK